MYFLHSPSTRHTLYSIRMPECIFCKIVRGELPSFKVYEDEKTLAFLDIHPINPGHALVIPKNHADTIFDISPEEWANVTEVTRMLAGVIEHAVGATGINLMMNNREHAGQIVGHAHMHIIPRFTNDNHRHWAHSSYKNDEATRIQEKIKQEM